jgi:hypothetical protein
MDSQISYQKVVDCKEWSVLRITPVIMVKEPDEPPRPKTPTLRSHDFRKNKHHIKISTSKNVLVDNKELDEFRKPNHK